MLFNAWWQDVLTMLHAHLSRTNIKDDAIHNIEVLERRQMGTSVACDGGPFI